MGMSNVQQNLLPEKCIKDLPAYVMIFTMSSKHLQSEALVCW